MRTQNKVKHQLRQVIYRHLQKRLRVNFKKTAVGCRHNREVPLDESTAIRFCGYMTSDGSPRNIVCDSRVDDNSLARACSLWDPYKTKDEVKAEFRALISSDRGAVAEQLPDVAALMWVLDDEGGVLPTDAEIDVVAANAVPVAPLGEDMKGWWHGLFRLADRLRE